MSICYNIPSEESMKAIELATWCQLIAYTMARLMSILQQWLAMDASNCQQCVKLSRFDLQHTVNMLPTSRQQVMGCKMICKHFHEKCNKWILSCGRSAFLTRNLMVYAWQSSWRIHGIRLPLLCYCICPDLVIMGIIYNIMAI